MYSNYDATKFHIYINNCNDDWSMNFISAVLQECGIHFDLENPPKIDSLDDLIKCLSSNNSGIQSSSVWYGKFGLSKFLTYSLCKRTIY